MTTPTPLTPEELAEGRRLAADMTAARKAFQESTAIAGSAEAQHLIQRLVNAIKNWRFWSEDEAARLFDTIDALQGDAEHADANLHVLASKVYALAGMPDGDGGGYDYACAKPLAVIREQIDALTKERDGLLSTSFCTKCGWSGVPHPWIKHPAKESGITLSWMCGNPGCEYLVPPPQQALLDSLREQLAASEAARERAETILSSIRGLTFVSLRDLNDGDVEAANRLAEKFGWRYRYGKPAEPTASEKEG